MARNIYHNSNPASWSHGDEMYSERTATLEDTWNVWEKGDVDEDGYGVSDWIDDMRRSDYFDDMPDAAVKELMYLIASNRTTTEIKNLVQHTKDYIETTLEI